MKKIAFLLLAFIILACSDNSSDPTNKEASSVNLEAVKSYPGFVGFQSIYDEYTPNAEMIDSIKSNFNSESDMFYIYLKPDCRCSPSTKTFPELIKTLELAGVPMTNVKMYIMDDETYSYPEKDIIEVNDLPQLFIKHNDEIVDISRPDEEVSIEALVYDSIKK